MVSWWLRWPPSLDNGQGMLPPLGLGPHMSRTFEQVSFPLSWQILLRALWELSRAGSLGPIGQMQTKLEPGNVEEFSLRIRIRINNWLSGCCCKSNPCDKIEMWKEDPGVGVHQVLGFRFLNKVLWSEMSFICLSPSERTALDSRHN